MFCWHILPGHSSRLPRVSFTGFVLCLILSTPGAHRAKGLIVLCSLYFFVWSVAVRFSLMGLKEPGDVCRRAHSLRSTEADQLGARPEASESSDVVDATLALHLEDSLSLAIDVVIVAAHSLIRMPSTNTLFRIHPHVRASPPRHSPATPSPACPSATPTPRRQTPFGSLTGHVERSKPRRSSIFFVTPW